jgi:hypothetical protein
MDDFSPEEMREFNENLNSMNASLGALNSGLQNLANTLNQTSQANQSAAKQTEENTQQQTSSTNQKTESIGKAGEQIKTTAEKMSGALRTATGAVISFSGALVSGVDGFDKYTKAVSGFGDSAKETGDALGGFGKFLGNAVNILAEFTVVTMKQADAQNQFAKEMNRMGAIVDTTTQGLAEQARAAGASAGDLQELAVIITQSSQALASFGAGTSEGTAKMLEVFRLSDDQEREMRRYGYTLKEAQEQQAYYIELQRTAGINMQASNMTEQDVRIKSLQYAKTLTTLSELTGIQAGQLKEQQAAVQADLRNKIRNIRDQNEIARLEEELQGDITAERRAALEAQKEALNNEITVRKDAGDQFAATMGADMAAKVMNVIGTGAFDENTKELANLGLNAAELKERFDGLTAGSDEFNQAVADTTAELVGGVRNNVDRFGKSMELAANASEIGAAVGINERTTDTAVLLGQEEDARKRVVDSFGNVVDATQKGADKQKDLAADLQVFETNVRTAADDFLNSMNPFKGGLDLGTIALGGFTIAIGTAATALMGLSGAGGLTNLIPGGGMVGKGVRAAGGFLSKGMARLIPGAAGALAIGGGIMEAHAGREEADAQLAQVTDAEDSSMAEIQRAKEQHEIDTKQANRKGAGTAIGGAGGALAGAAAGAAIGSFIPIIGTAIGGIIGGALGAYGGAKGGSALGEALSPEDLKMYEASDAEVMLMSPEEKKEYDRVVKAIEDQTKAQEAEAERLENVYKENIDVIKDSGLYDKDWFGNSEVDFEMLAQMRDDGTLTQGMLEAMLYDNDLSEADQALVQKQLDLMKADSEKAEEKDKKEKDVAEVKEEEVGGRTLDMSPENLAKIFEADLKATAQRDAEKQAEAEKERVAVVKAKEESVKEQITPEVIANALKDTGSGAPTPGLVDTEQLLATTQVVENMIADTGELTGSPVLEEIETTAERIPVDSILEEVKVSSSKIATLIESPAIKKAVDPLDELRNMDNGFGGTLGGMVTRDNVTGGYIATGQFGARDPLAIGEPQALTSKQFASEEEALRALAAPQEWEAQLQAELDANFAEMMAEIDAKSPETTPVVDISPEASEEKSDDGMSAEEKFAQTGKEYNDALAEKIDLLIAAQTENNMIAKGIKDATVEGAEASQKIAINSAV